MEKTAKTTEADAAPKKKAGRPRGAKDSFKRIQIRRGFPTLIAALARVQNGRIENVAARGRLFDKLGLIRAASCRTIVVLMDEILDPDAERRASLCGVLNTLAHMELQAIKTAGIAPIDVAPGLRATNGSADGPLILADFLDRPD